MENRVVYLTRHGNIQQEDNQRRYIGQIDLRPTEEGIKQGAEFREKA
jgi:broad specificity phosphatase PhoE